MNSDFCIMLVDDADYRDKIFLSPNDELKKYYLQYNGFCILHIPSHMLTEELCLIAVSEYGNAIKYIKKQTRKVVLLALKNGASAKHINKEFLYLYVNKCT